MRRFTQVYCCAALALCLVSGQTFAGPLGSAASDAFRRLPQSAPPPAANAGDPAPAAAPAATSGETGGVVVQDTNAPAGPVDLVSDPANPLPPEAPAYGGTPPTGGATNGGGGVQTSQVPEPGVLWLLGAGVLGLALARRRRK